MLSEGRVMTDNSKTIVFLVKATKKMCKEMTKESALKLLTNVGVFDKKGLLTTNYHSEDAVEEFKRTMAATKF